MVNLFQILKIREIHGFSVRLTSLPKAYFPQTKMFLVGSVNIYSEEQFQYTIILLCHCHLARKMYIEPLYASCFLSHNHSKVSQTSPARREPHNLGQHAISSIHPPISQFFA